MKAENKIELPTLNKILELYKGDEQLEQWAKYRQEIFTQQHIRLKQFTDHYIPSEKISDSFDYKVQKFVNDCLEPGYSVIFWHERNKLIETKDTVRDRVFAKIDKYGEKGYTNVGAFNISSPKKNPNVLAFELSLQVLYPFLDIKKLDVTLDSHQKKSTEVKLQAESGTKKEATKVKIKQ